jgi:hypothetical protein
MENIPAVTRRIEPSEQSNTTSIKKIEYYHLFMAMVVEAAQTPSLWKIWE